MKKYDHLKIGGHGVEVKFYKRREMSGNIGESWNVENIIRICEDYPESQQEEALIHELLHHVMSNLVYPYKKEDATAIHSEITVEALAQGLYQVLKDNEIVFSGSIKV